MSRTARHLPPSHGRAAGDHRPGAPWHAVVLHDLRAGNGAVPTPIRRSVAVYRFPRHHQDRTVARMAAVAERSARQLLRARLGAVVRLVNSPTGELVVQAADTVDVPPARHRHAALWLA